MRVLSILATLAFVQQTLLPTAQMASLYIKSINEKRFGDAIWARYHIYGDMEDGIVGGSNNMTVLDTIEEDAREYRVSEPELYAEALSFYVQTSSQDTHIADVLDLIRHICQEDVTELGKRLVYGISCSSNYLTTSTSCNSLISYMS
ncbi:hypothetical protein N7495_004931 [Penicillium taxi]|uniref:uncharacterized protein n=1 Tax=Penicillium taxi TaxID=168475 RepID=UPI0025452F29|nr:uncharacterized protein N7495_004931 [Penicillium taxi]KAJ5893240.1 hypothetical protein N7495_004931 [Penicillium taxi]